MKKPPIRTKIKKDGFSESGLPTDKILGKIVDSVTPERKKNTVRGTGLSQDGRERLNTMLRPDLKDWLFQEARKRRVSFADVLEIELLERYNSQ